MILTALWGITLNKSPQPGCFFFKFEKRYDRFLLAIIPIPRSPGTNIKAAAGKVKIPTQCFVAMNRTHRMTAVSERSYRECLERLDGLRFVTALQMA